MAETNLERRGPWRAGCGLAIVLGLLTVIASFSSLAMLLGRPPSIPSEEWPVNLFQVLLAASPFGLLALAGVRTKLPWIVAAVLTVCFWGALIVSALIAARNQTGANIGMGLIMFFSPIPIAGGAFLAANLTRN